MVVRACRTKNTKEIDFYKKILQDYTRSLLFLRCRNNCITIKSILILIYINILTSLYIIFLMDTYRYLLLLLSMFLFCITNGLIQKLMIPIDQEYDSLDRSLNIYSFIYINYLSLSNLPSIIILSCTNIIPKSIYFFIFVLFHNFYLTTNLRLNQILRIVFLINIVLYLYLIINRYISF